MPLAPELNGRRLIDGGNLNLLASGQGFRTRGPLTARVGGGRPTAVPLSYGMNQVSTVTTAADSVILPRATAGTVVWLANADAADAVQVFAQGTNTINGTAGATGISVAATKNAGFFCVIDGQWRLLLSA